MQNAAEGGLYWRLPDPNHADVLRAVKLLQNPGADAADDQRRRQWVADLQRNNTIVRMAVEPTYPPADRNRSGHRRSQRRSLGVATLPRRQWERLVCRSPAAGPRFCLYRFRGFVHRRRRRAVRWPAAAVGQTGRQLVGRGRATADRPRTATERSAPASGSSWYGNRKLLIADKALASPGFYLLAAEANGQTALRRYACSDLWSAAIYGAPAQRVGFAAVCPLSRAAKRPKAVMNHRTPNSLPHRLQNSPERIRHRGQTKLLLHPLPPGGAEAMGLLRIIEQGR